MNRLHILRLTVTILLISTLSESLPYISRAENISEYINCMPDSNTFTDELLYTSNKITASTVNMLSPFIEVSPGKKFTVQYLKNQSDINYTITACRTFAAYDSEKKFIQGSMLENQSSPYVYQIPENASYIRVCIAKTYILNSSLKTMFIINDTGEALTTKAQSEQPNNPPSSDDDTTPPPFDTTEIINSFTCYEPTNKDYIPITGYLNTAKKTEWLYGLYDKLMEQYPEYITKTKIAETAEPIDFYNKKGEKLSGLKSGIPMYRYDFKPPENNITDTPPKILYTSGIHGGEYYQVIAGYRFFKMLCESRNEHELLSDLYRNVHFVVIPLTNPFGFQYPSNRYDVNGISVAKRNEHAIDISGNFPSDNYVENEGSEYKYGKAPLTEPESVALYNIICNEEFILSIDNHTFNNLSNASNTRKMVGYFIANKNNKSFWEKICTWMESHVRKLSPEIDDSFNEYDMAQIWPDNRQQMLSNTFRSTGANAEMTIGIHPTDGNLLKEETQAFCVDELAVLFYQALHSFSPQIIKATDLKPRISFNSPLNIGQTTEIIFTDSNGMYMDMTEFSRIEYNSTNPDTITINNSGQITAKRMGISEISAVVYTKNNNELPVALSEAIVVGNERIYIKNAVNKSGVLTLDLHTPQEHSPFKIYVALYNNKSLVSVTAHSISQNEYIDNTLNITLDNNKIYDEVYIYVWDMLNPLWIKTRAK